MCSGLYGNAKKATVLEQFCTDSKNGPLLKLDGEEESALCQKDINGDWVYLQIDVLHSIIDQVESKFLSFWKITF